MKSQRTIFKWIGVSVVLAMFLGFAAISPPALAQEEVPPTATETPTEISALGTPFPTIIPTPMMEEETPLQLQSQEQLIAPLQSLEQPTSSLNPEWPAFNISDTEIDSTYSSIATDSTGNLHIAWIEQETNGLTDIYYSYWDGEKLSTSTISTNRRLN
jgi:hypothetical protein